VPPVAAEAGQGSRAGLLLSAAVVPDRATVEHKFQDWPEWPSASSWTSCPMAYTPTTASSAPDETRTVATRGRAVWIGIGAYRLPVEAWWQAASGAQGRS
jgi:hypothetical protein